MSLSYYKHISNWHSHPTLSKIMCKLGRHDFSPIHCAVDTDDLNRWYVTQQCFYCGHLKETGFTIHPEGYR